MQQVMKKRSPPSTTAQRCHPGSCMICMHAEAVRCIAIALSCIAADFTDLKRKVVAYEGRHSCSYGIEQAT